MKALRKIFFILFSAIPAALVAPGHGEVRNFFEVDPVNRLYRSAQPGKEEFQDLKKRGFRSVLNLRNFHTNRRMLRGTGLESFAVPGNAGDMTEQHIRQALQVIRDGPKPMLVHCWHGSDRTGAVIAAARIVFQGWSIDRALAEMLEPRYGHHRDLYDNLPVLLRSIDWDAMRESLKSDPLPPPPEAIPAQQILRVEYLTEAPFRLRLGNQTFTDPDSALNAITSMLGKQSYQVVVLTYHFQVADSFTDRFHTDLNRLPEVHDLIRINAVPAAGGAGTDTPAGPDFHTELNARLQIPDGWQARVMPHRVIWRQETAAPTAAD